MNPTYLANTLPADDPLLPYARALHTRRAIDARIALDIHLIENPKLWRGPGHFTIAPQKPRESFIEFVKSLLTP